MPGVIQSTEDGGDKHKNKTTELIKVQIKYYRCTQEEAEASLCAVEVSGNPPRDDTLLTDNRSSPRKGGGRAVEDVARRPKT